MKKLLVLLVFSLAVMTCLQTGRAEDSGKIQKLENEINALKKATADQDQRIHSLEGRVGSQEATLSQKEPSPSSQDASATDDPAPKKANRANEPDRKYID